MSLCSHEIFLNFHMLSSSMSDGEINGLLEEGFVVVDDKSAVDFLHERGYGFLKEGRLYLTMVEAAYMVYRGFMKVRAKSGEALDFFDIVNMGLRDHSDFWTILNVYADLRNRALIVKPGIDPLELLVDWKKKNRVRRMLVRIVKEGTRLGFAVFEDMFRRALESGRELVMAVVDKEGVVSYYLVEGVSRVGPEIAASVEVHAEQEG